MEFRVREASAGIVVTGALILLITGGALSCQQQNVAALVPSPVATETPAPPVELAANASPEDSVTPSPPPSPTPPAPIKVHVTGAVKKPGVYTLKAGMRVEDAIQMAGGFLPNAQQDAINLADYAQDADMYNIPEKDARAKKTPAKTAPVRPAVVRKGPRKTNAAKEHGAPAAGRVLGKAVAAEHSSPSVIPGDTSPAGAPAGAADKFKSPGDGLVNLNTATAEELQRLPGVGPSYAARIIEYRETQGRFADISQIMDVKGIGPKKFEKMRPFLTVE